MLVSFPGQPAKLFSRTSRLKLPYFVFLSGIVIGVMASLALVTSETHPNVSVTPNHLLVSNTPSPALRGSSALSAPPKPVSVFYFVVDSETKASELAKAMSKSPGAHENFVITEEEADRDAHVGLAMAVAELTNAGISVQVVDLRH